MKHLKFLDILVDLCLL